MARLWAAMLANISVLVGLVSGWAPRADGPVDWPMFGGSPARNMANLTVRGLPATFDPARDCRWAADLGTRAYTQPVASGGIVLVGTNNKRPRNPRDTRRSPDGEIEPLDRAVLMCFETATGRFRWQAVFDPPVVAGVLPWPGEGLFSTPAVDGDRAFLVTPAGVITCLDLAGFADGNQGLQTEPYRTLTDADVIWEYDLRRELGVFPHWPSSSSPLVVGDRVFVCTGNGVDDGHLKLPAPDAPSFVAIDKRTGRLLWKIASPGRNVLHGQWSSPAYASDPIPQVIFPGGDGWLRAFDPTCGRLLWAFDGNPTDAVYRIDGSGTRTDFVAAPVVVGGRVYIAHGQDPEFPDGPGRLWCLDLAKAVTAGAARPDRVVSPVLPGEMPNPRAVAAWCYTAPDFGRSNSTVSVVGDVLYTSDLTGKIHCLDARTGRLFWRYDMKAGVRGSPLYADGKVYIGTDTGTLFVWRHSANPQPTTALREVEERYLLGRVEFPDPIRAALSVAGDSIYVSTERKLYRIGGP